MIIPELPCVPDMVFFVEVSAFAAWKVLLSSPMHTQPLVLAHLPCGQPLSLFTVHHQQASTEDLDPCLEFCPANAHP